MLDRILDLMRSCHEETSPIRATEFYNEGWMLRLVLDWFSRNESPGSELSLAHGCRWHSEALLYTPFAPRHQGDPTGESHTHADGVIGQFRIGGDTHKEGFVLDTDATVFVVLEAKMYSPLSKGTSHAKSYNQAARNVACMAHCMQRANLEPHEDMQLQFNVIAPKDKIQAHGIADALKKKALLEMVEARLASYRGGKGKDKRKKKYCLDEWHDKYFLPLMARTKFARAIAWEKLLDEVADPDARERMWCFYRRCLWLNASKKQQGEMGDLPNCLC